MPVDARADKLIRRTTMIGTVTAAYFLLTSDFGSQPNALDPLKKAIESAQFSLKNFVFGSDKKPNENAKEEPKIDRAK